MVARLCASRPRRTTFKVYLPKVEGARALARNVLEKHGYRVLEAGSGKDALERVRGEKGPIHLLLTDLGMPDMGGMGVASRLQNLYPDIRVLFISGYTDEGVVRNGLLRSVGKRRRIRYDS